MNDSFQLCSSNLWWQKPTRSESIHSDASFKVGIFSTAMRIVGSTSFTIHANGAVSNVATIEPTEVSCIA